jgi:enoyl-CoA hydratase
MQYEHILVDIEDGVAVITLNRPDKLNAMNRKLGEELQQALKLMEADDQVGCLVFTGAGDRAFSAGGDIREQLEDDAKFSDKELETLRSGKRSYDIGTCTKPTIGMMNGLAYGGGSVLASSLDIRVGCEGAKFRFLAAAYGRINSTWTLPNQVGWPMAKELLFSARIIEADEAYRIGLLNHLVPRAELRSKTMALAKQIASNHRGAVMGVKKLLLDNMAEDITTQFNAERDYIANVQPSAKAKDAFPEFMARKGISN